MVRVDVKLVIAGVKVHEREGREPVMRPLVKGDKHPAILGIVHVVAVIGGKELGRHPLDLGRENVFQPSAKGLGVVTFATEAE